MDLDRHRLIVILDFLHLWRWISVLAIADAVATEIVITRALAKVTAVCLKFIAIAVFLCQRLVDIIPDKATLEKRFLFHKVCIFVQRTTGIAHSVCIFAKNIRLVTMLL